LSVLIGRLRFGFFPRPKQSKRCGKNLDEASFDAAAQLLMFFAQRLQLALHILQAQQFSFQPRDMRFRYPEFVPIHGRSVAQSHPPNTPNDRNDEGNPNAQMTNWLPRYFSSEFLESGATSI